LALAKEFVELYGGRFPKEASIFEAGTRDALTYLLSYPGYHRARISTTNMVEWLFKEVKRRTVRVVGMFHNEERSVATLATEIALKSSEEWALKRDGDTDFEFVGSTIEVSPSNSTTCDQQVNQAASAFGS
jgi:transposase-like protein